MDGTAKMPFRKTRRPALSSTIAIWPLRAHGDDPQGDEHSGVRTAPRSPWQNAHVERVIGSIRRDCLDYMIVVNTALHRVLAEYVA
jgi:hypothetical protein